MTLDDYITRRLAQVTDDRAYSQRKLDEAVKLYNELRGKDHLADYQQKAHEDVLWHKSRIRDYDFELDCLYTARDAKADGHAV